jgi:hypothetical protein
MYLGIEKSKENVSTENMFSTWSTDAAHTEN